MTFAIVSILEEERRKMEDGRWKLDICVNPRQSIVICDPRNSLFLTADEGRLTQINADELDQF